MTRHLRLFLAAVFAFAIAAPVLAHDLGLARISVTEDRPGNFRLTAKLSGSADVGPGEFPGPCTGDNGPVRKPSPTAQIIEIALSCPETLATDRLIRLPWKVEGAHVLIADGSGREPLRFVRARSDGLWLTAGDLRTGTTEPIETARLYISLGIEHILTGLDHLAVVLLLCLIATGWRLIKLVTCFTIGHSITLALAALGFVQVPVAPIEALIALSIAFLAREALIAEDPAGKSPLMITGFGMLHGLGFASYLSEVGLPRGEIVTALLSFNVGVELGQLAFIVFVAPGLYLLRRVRPLFHPIGLATPIILGVIAMTWAVERVHGAAG